MNDRKISFGLAIFVVAAFSAFAMPAWAQEAGATDPTTPPAQPVPPAGPPGPPPGSPPPPPPYYQAQPYPYYPPYPGPAYPPPRYMIEPHRTFIRGHLWIGDGAAWVGSANDSAANRFRTGAEIHLGRNYQWILGWTFFDLLSSGESAPNVGGISRNGSDFELGYFVVPDSLWVMYSFYIGSVKGNQFAAYENNFGHGLSVGYRFYSEGDVNLALELSYLYLESETAPSYDFLTQTVTTATYPHASVLGLNLRVGFDIGG